MSDDFVKITTPVARLVGGSLYKPRTKDALGNPLTVKKGPNIGAPKSVHSFSIAIKKNGETHWNQTSWGRLIWDKAHADFPQGQARRENFSWKITDGDSDIPNSNENRPCDREGWPGCWVLHFSSAPPPRIWTRDLQSLPDEDAIKLGDYVQVGGTVLGNGETLHPGIYLNHLHVIFVGYGQRITFLPGTDEFDFQSHPVPPEVSATPLPVTAPSGSPPPAAVAPAAPQPATAAYVPQATTVPVTPHTAILDASNVASAPVPPTAPPAYVGPQKIMTALAAGATYEAFIQKGWTDEAMIRGGYMVIK